MKSVAPLLLAFIVGMVVTLSIKLDSPRNVRFIFSTTTQFANGSSYLGPLNEAGQLEGYGRMTWRNGDEYEGEFSNGFFDGKGKLTLVNTGIYEGDFSQGDRQGRGKLTYDGGGVYEGEFAKNKFNGSGKLINADGSIYEGTFINHKMTGRGKWLFADKTTYTGEVREGVLHGKGQLIRPDETKYTGDFEKGIMHGNGVFETKDRRIYSGSFQQGEFTGKGAYKNAEGDTYSGDFSRWVLNGKGIQTDKKGNHWEGDFVNGMLDGEGSYLGKDGVSYIGQFKMGEYDGTGKLVAANGDIYQGEFSYGKKDGKGTISYQEPIDGIKQIKGRWDYDRLVEGDENLKIFSAEEVGEFAMYYQLAKLTTTLDAVQASNPDKVELYSLVVAAYGTEEVFNRESTFIENLFSTQYHNRTTAIYLANSQRSLGEHPMATLSSIRAAITRIAEKMDKERDIFFLYITSHGSKDKKISLHHNGIALQDIDSKWLAEQLAASGIKHRIVVLSACYSGGFMDELKEGNSLVITSSAADRTSFGCADDSLFTYFGRAYFKESLKPDVDFEHAFYTAQGLVSKWEAAKKMKPSNPQIYKNEQRLKHIRSWQQQSHTP